MTTVLLPYKSGSASARNLASALRVRRMRLEDSNLSDSSDNTIINWGNTRTDLSRFRQVRVLNTQSSVSTATNKLSCFEAMVGSRVQIPEFTTDIDVARSWIRDGKKVVCRTVLNGHSGRGIVIAESEDQLVEAPLYTKYVPKTDEYRVHVVAGVPVWVQRKARRSDVPDDQVNWQVRNHSNGFIFATQNVRPQDGVVDQAILAIAAVGLDFGAVDIVYNTRNSRAVVLEINTACGLEGTTLQVYRDALRSVLAGALPNRYTERNPSTTTQEETTVTTVSGEDAALEQLRSIPGFDSLERYITVTYDWQENGDSHRGPGFSRNMQHLTGNTYQIQSHASSGSFIIEDEEGHQWTLHRSHTRRATAVEALACITRPRFVGTIHAPGVYMGGNFNDFWRQIITRANPEAQVRELGANRLEVVSNGLTWRIV